MSVQKFVQHYLYFLLQEQESVVSIFFFPQDRNVGCIVVLNMGLLLYFFFFVTLTVLRDRNNHNNTSDWYPTKVSC